MLLLQCEVRPATEDFQDVADRRVFVVVRGFAMSSHWDCHCSLQRLRRSVRFNGLFTHVLQRLCRLHSTSRFSDFVAR